MLKNLVFLLSLIPFTVSARMENSPIELWELPFQNKAVNVTILVVDNDINLACNTVNQKVGRGYFRQFVAGCAYWSLNKEPRVCVILVSKFTNNDIVGHEFRHCLVGTFHED